jgi:hypothetical protein
MVMTGSNDQGRPVGDRLRPWAPKAGVKLFVWYGEVQLWEDAPNGDLMVFEWDL